MTNQLSISYLSDLAKEGERRRDVGIKAATDHAERESEGWSERAYNVLQSYIRSKKVGSSFKLEDVRIHANLNSLIDKPPHERAWGSIILRAAKNKLIIKIGYTQVVNPKAHMANCSLWQII